MQGRSDSIGSALAFEFAPAVIFGSAVGFSTATIFGLPPFSLTPAAAGAAAFGCVWLTLGKSASKKRHFPLPAFDQSEFERELSAAAELAVQQAEAAEVAEEDADELILDQVLVAPTAQSDEADELLLDEVVAPPTGGSDQPDELVLNDILKALDPASRVVRLFQPNDSAGELQARIDKHLRSAPRQVPPDATQELHEALAALRRSLR